MGETMHVCGRGMWQICVASAQDCCELETGFNHKDLLNNKNHTSKTDKDTMQLVH